MKKIILTAFTLVASLAASAQTELTLRFDSLQTGKVVVRMINETYTGYERTDTLMLKDGSLAYNDPAQKGFHLVMFAALPADGSRPKYQFETFVAPGQKGTVTVKGENAKMTGTKMYTDYQAILDLMDATPKESREDAALNYVKAHAGDDASVLMCMEMEKPENGLAVLSAQVRNGVMKTFITAQEEQLKKQREREAKLEAARKFLQPGMPAPEITLNDLDGKPLSLSQLKGKYVILDWWGSWCIWCIRGIPKMKEYYAKYSDKLEILGIDCNDTEAKWKEAVKKYELPWKHVYKPKDSKLTETYAIEGYPTKCILNPDGTIHKIIIGEDPEFYAYLDELLK